MGDRTFPSEGTSQAGVRSIQFRNLTTGMPTCIVDTDSTDIAAGGAYVNGAAAADVVSHLLWRVPANIRVTGAYLLPDKASTGIAATSHTCIVSVEKWPVAGGASLGNIATKTKSANSVASTPEALTLSTTYWELKAGQTVRLSITQIGNADLDNAVGADATCFHIQLDYILLDDTATIADA